MAKQIAKLLKTDVMADLDMPAIAQLLSKMGRKGDKILAHITPKEAKKLKAEGGSGTINPKTGLPEFYDPYDDSFSSAGYAPDEIARKNQDLYAGGQLPQSGEETAYSLPNPVDYSSVSREVQPTQEAQLPFQIAPSAQVSEAGAPAATGAPAFYAEGAGPAEQMGAATPGQAAGTTQFSPKEKGFWDALSPQQKLQFALSGGLTGLSAILGQRGIKQAQQAKREIADIGAPYRQQGQEMISAAQRGELTPAGQQTLQAARARLAQDVTRRGGAGAQQTETQLANLRNNLLQQQYQYGLKVASIGDQYAARAIQTGLTQDAEMAKLMQQLAGSIGGIFGAQPRAQ